MKYKISLNEIVNEAERVLNSDGRGMVYITSGDPIDNFMLVGELRKRGLLFEIGVRRHTDKEYHINLSKIDLQY